MFLSIHVGIWLTVAVSGAMTAQCHDGWIRHGSSCYLFVQLKESWIEAEDYCRIMKGMLAEIGDAQENSFLMTTMAKLNVNGGGSAYWIGGTDIAVEGQWEWVVSGDRFHFTDWHPGEPNNVNKTEACLEITPGYRWNDIICDVKRYFICEADENLDVNIIG